MNVNQPGTPTQEPKFSQVSSPRAGSTFKSNNSRASSAASGQALVKVAQQHPVAQHDSSKNQKMRETSVKHQQQRLLLLRHAAKCQTPESRLCPVTRHCAGMKRLWKHITECKNTKCLTPHCVSSRYVLSHYHRCQYLSCEVCQPVRQAIDKSHRLSQGVCASMRSSSVSNQGSAAAPVHTSQQLSESPNKLRQSLVSRIIRLASRQFNTRGSVQAQQSAKELAQHIEAELFNSRPFKQYLEIKDAELEDLISEQALHYDLGRLKLA